MPNAAGPMDDGWGLMFGVAVVAFVVGVLLYKFTPEESGVSTFGIFLSIVSGVPAFIFMAVIFLAGAVPTAISEYAGVWGFVVLGLVAFWIVGHRKSKA